MKWCAICFREQRGLGFMPKLTHHNKSEQRFCSMVCLDLFARLFKETNGMVDMTDFERAALNACLIPLSECVSQIGLEKPLAEYTKEQVLTVIEVVVTAFQSEMRKGSLEVPF